MDRRSLLAMPFVLAAVPARAEAALSVRLGDAEAEVVLRGETDAALHALIRRWVEKSGDAVIAYFGRFPVPRLRIVVSLVPGGRVQGGRMLPDAQNPRISIRAGRATSERGFLVDDWVMVHEMIHTALPWMGRRAAWLSEGVAVYVESIARVMAGHLSEADIWPAFVRMMPRGMPQPGQRGFAVDRSWARIYWGGAAYCLACDVEMLRQSGMRHGLCQALRGINAVTDTRQRRPLAEVLRLGDQATGMTVLTDMFRALADEPVETDLAGLWRELGVSDTTGSVTDDSAPGAALRRALFKA